MMLSWTRYILNTLHIVGKIDTAAVFRIRDMLVRIRIQIRGSVSLTNGSGSGSCFFSSVTFETNKTIFACCWKDPDRDPYLWLTDPDLGGPKGFRSCASGLDSEHCSEENNVASRNSRHQCYRGHRLAINIISRRKSWITGIQFPNKSRFWGAKSWIIRGKNLPALSI